MFKVLSIFFMMLALMLFYVGVESVSIGIGILYILNSIIFLFVSKEFWEWC